MALAFPLMLLKCLLMEIASFWAGHEHVMNDASYSLLSRRDEIERLSIKGTTCLPGTQSLLPGRTGTCRRRWLSRWSEIDLSFAGCEATWPQKMWPCFSRNVPKWPL
jgi:hypothetical protein